MRSLPADDVAEESDDEELDDEELQPAITIVTTARQQSVELTTLFTARGLHQSAGCDVTGRGAHPSHTKG